MWAGAGDGKPSETRIYRNKEEAAHYLVFTKRDHLLFCSYIAETEVSCNMLKMSHIDFICLIQNAQGKASFY